MKTVLLYKTDPHVFECSALVLSSRKESGETMVVLDRTPFYPEGGGQPSDKGFLDGYPVREVVERDGDVLHLVEGEVNLSSGQQVLVSVNRERRRDHTQQHSGQHLLSANLLRIKGAPTRSFHMGSDYSTIDIDIPSLDPADADFVEAEVNRMIAEDYAYRKYICTQDEALLLPLRRKPPEGEEEIRIVEIDGFDFTPCCGTHVDHALEIQLLKIIRYEKYKGMTRVYFVAGFRAYAYLSKVHSGMEGLAKAFGANTENLASVVLGVKDKLEKAECEANYWKNAAVRNAAETLCRGASDGKLLVRITDEDFDYATKLAKALAEKGIASAVASISTLRMAIAIPEGTKTDLANLVKNYLDSGKIRGGGGKNFFQLGTEDKAEFEEVLELLGRMPLA